MMYGAIPIQAQKHKHVSTRRVRGWHVHRVGAVSTQRVRFDRRTRTLPPFEAYMAHIFFSLDPLHRLVLRIPWPQYPMLQLNDCHYSLFESLYEVGRRGCLVITQWRNRSL